MLTQRNPSLFAARATSLIVAACRSAGRPVVLLPALYCADVAAAIEEAGLRYRCYDVPSSLSSASSLIDMAYGRDVGVVVALHPFGLSRPPFGLSLPPETLLIEDACHALRTAVGTPALGSFGHLTVYSPRKEFGWPEGGAASGSLALSLKREVSHAARVARRWRQHDLKALAHEGQQATRLAAAALADKLPPVIEGEVLSALPLKSARRDATIKRLRAQGVAAWRWLRPLKQTGRGRTPQAWRLRSKLLLVPVPNVAEVDRLLHLLRDEPLEDWDVE
jgi:dTDP-4-amino-4,6-dideoxygalactose transaminase